MTHTVWIKHVTYNPDHEMVKAELSGEMGGRHVDIQLQFALRAHRERPEADIRTIALLEIQQILRSASNVTLLEQMTADPAAEQG